MAQTLAIGLTAKAGRGPCDDSVLIVLMLVHGDQTRGFKPEPLQHARGTQVRQLRFERIWGPKPLVYGLK